MSEHRALRDTRGAAGVLQECDVVVRRRHRLERQELALFERVVEAQCARQLVRRDLLAHVAHDQVHDRGLRPAELVADAGDQHVLDTRPLDHLFERVREVLQDQDRLRTGIAQLMLELARGVERIRVDDSEPGAQRAEQRDRILQDVRQHDRDPVAPLQFRALLQPGREVACPPVELGISDRAAEAAESALRREALAAGLEHRRERRVFVRIDLRRHAVRVVLQPDLVHFSSTWLKTGHRLSSNRGWAAAVGWMPSACISFSSSATPSRKKPRSGVP